jgi:hypothetical protein
VAVVARNQPKMVPAEAQAAVAPVTPLTHRLGWGAQALQGKVMTVLTVTAQAAQAAAVVARVLLVLSATAAQVQRLLLPAHRSHALAVARATQLAQGEQAAAVVRAMQDRPTLAVVAAQATPYQVALVW